MSEGNDLEVLYEEKNYCATKSEKLYECLRRFVWKHVNYLIK
jgi:hypothetical protein